MSKNPQSQVHKGNKSVNNGTKNNKSILQWNCHGFRPNFEEIRNLISNLRPYSLALQETHFKETDNVNIRGFDHYFKTCVSEVDGKATGGCSILVYIPPHFNVAQSDLYNLVNQLPAPFLFIGDFNAHSDLLGCSTSNSLGNKVEHLLESSNICLLNDKSPTYFHPATGSFTSIDLFYVLHLLFFILHGRSILISVVVTIFLF